MDGPHQGLKTYAKSTKWTDTTKGHKLIRSPLSGRTPPRVKNLYNPKSGRTQQGSDLYNSKKKRRGWTLQTFKTPRHIKNGPNQFIKLYKSTKWTAIRGHNHIPRNERTLPESQILWRSTTWMDQIKQIPKQQDGSYTTIINRILKEAFK